MMQYLYTLSTDVKTSMLITVISFVVGMICYSVAKAKQIPKLLKWVVGLLMGICMVTFVAVVALNLIMAAYTKVPNVVGLQQDDAINQLHAANLDVSYTAIKGENVRVIAQSPEKSTLVPPDTLVTLTLKSIPLQNLGPDNIDDSEVVIPTETTAPAAEATVSTMKTGNTITFGTYMQEPIRWKILDIQDGKALLLSEKVLDCLPYNSSYGSTSWDKSYLRDWLNGIFLETAFGKESQKAILTTTVDNSVAQGNPAWPGIQNTSTQDKIFLLSYAEFKKYVDGTADSICEVAYSTGDETDIRYRLLDDGTKAAFWWLRSPGKDDKQAAYINFEGICYSNYVGNGYISVRPAMWVNLAKLN